jgi:hypothetical protein
MGFRKYKQLSWARMSKPPNGAMPCCGGDEHHPEGAYYLEWYQDGKRRRQAVSDFAEVLEAARGKSIEGNAHGAGLIEAGPVAELRRVTTAQAIDARLDVIKAYRKEQCCISPRADMIGGCVAPKDPPKKRPSFQRVLPNTGPVHPKSSNPGRPVDFRRSNCQQIICEMGNAMAANSAGSAKRVGLGETDKPTA